MRKKLKKLTPYQRIIRAGEKGVGVHLSAPEIAIICTNTAIIDAAWNDDQCDLFLLWSGYRDRHPTIARRMDRVSQRKSSHKEI